jgi:hypothetical protein
VVNSRAHMQPKPYARRKKICWCTPSCGKLLSTRSRRQHYKALTPPEYLFKNDSESEDEVTTKPQKLCRLRPAPPVPHRIGNHALSNDSLVHTAVSIEGWSGSLESTIQGYPPAIEASAKQGATAESIPTMAGDSGHQTHLEDDVLMSSGPDLSSESESESESEAVDSKYCTKSIITGLLMLGCQRFLQH